MQISNIIKNLSIKTPKNIALETSTVTINYACFYKFVKIVKNLIEIQNPKSIVIYGEKKIFAIICIFAALFSKRTYVPLSKNLPRERISKIIKIIKPELFINCSERKFQLSVKTIKISNISFFLDYKNCKRKKNRHNRQNREKLAYIIFTSGSTGEPKGVCISKKALNYYVGWLSNNILIGRRNSCLQFSELGFDLSIMDTFATLISGGRLVITENDYEKNYIGRFIKEKKINNCVFVPSIVNVLKNSGQLRYFKNVKKIIFCGEPLLKSHLTSLFNINKNLKIINTYGPTEATVSCTKLVLNSKNYNKFCFKNSVSLGKPIRGVNFMIDYTQLNKNELLISGTQLFEKYFKNKAETNKKKILINKKIFYRTGDLVFLYNKNYYFVKRIDKQIKINGMRIELEEINHQLKNNCNFVHTFVKKNKIYAIVKTKLKLTALYKKLSLHLPKYCIPSKILKIKNLLYNSNGKIDYYRMQLCFLKSLK